MIIRLLVYVTLITLTTSLFAAEPTPAASAPPPRVVDAGSGGMIEIALPDGTVIRVGEEVGLAALRRVVAALRA